MVWLGPVVDRGSRGSEALKCASVVGCFSTVSVEGYCSRDEAHSNLLFISTYHGVLCVFSFLTW